MTFTTWKIDRIPYNGSSWDTSSSSSLTGFFDVQTSIALGNNKGDFSFKVKNTNGVYNNYFTDRKSVV